MLQHHLRRRRTVTTKGGLTLPRTGLLLHIPLPNAYLPIDWDEEIGWESPMRGYQATPGDDTLFAAAPQLYDGDVDSPLILSDMEILALSGINTTVNGIEVSFSVAAGLAVRWHRIAYIPNAYPFVDKDGANTRTLYGLQYIHLAGDTDFTCGGTNGIVGTETVTSQPAGTATITVAAGKLTIGAGDLWSFALSNGSTYEFGTILTATTGVVFDTSGNGRHLLFTVADTSAVCLSGREKGSDHCATKGWSDEGVGYTGKLVPNRTDQVSDAATIPRIADRINLGATAGYVMSITSSDQLTNSLNPADTYTPDGSGGFYVYNDGSTLGKVGTTAMFPCVAGRVYDIAYHYIKIGAGAGNCRIVSSVGGTNYDIDYSDPENVVNSIGYVRKRYTAITTGFFAIQFPLLYSGQVWEYSVRDISVTESIPVVAQNYIVDTIRCMGDSTSLSYPYILRNHAINCNIFMGGVGGETSTQIKTRVLAETTAQKSMPHILWAGANNVESAPNTVISDVAAMVEFLGHDDYSIIGPLGNSEATTGSAYRTNINAVNSTFAASYPGKHINIEQILIDSYNPLIPQDVTDHNNGVTPTSLRTDTIHLTIDGYTVVEQALLNTFPAFFVRQVGTTHIKYPGSAKQNITRISGTGTTLADGDTYTLPDSHTFRTAVGWTYGVDHWAYTSLGVPKEVSGATIKSNGDGLRWYVGTKGLALYSADQTIKDAKIKKYLKVPA